MECEDDKHQLNPLETTGHGPQSEPLWSLEHVSIDNALLDKIARNKIVETGITQAIPSAHGLVDAGETQGSGEG